MTRFACTVALLTCSMANTTSAGEHAELFRRLDADRDGRLVAAEVPKDQLTLYKRLVRIADKDRDGVLNLKEFEAGLTSTRPEKPLAEKVENTLPGSDALLLFLAWMDLNADLVVTSDEVTAEMQPLFDELADLLNLKNKSRIPVSQLSQQAIQFAGRANRFAMREGIDVEVEMALLSDAQVACVERLRNSFRGRERLMNAPNNAMMLFSQLDTDGDGNVTAAEIPEALSERFAGVLARADRNQDKQLSEQEFKNFSDRAIAFETNRPPLAETTQRARHLIGRLDRDGNDLLNRQEAPPRMAQRFARLDQNGDGQLDFNEVARGVEILSTLRNSAGFSPASTPAKRPGSKIPAQN